MAEEGRRADQRPEGWAGAVQEKAQGATQKATEGAAYVQNQLRAVDHTVQDYTGKHSSSGPRISNPSCVRSH